MKNREIKVFEHETLRVGDEERGLKPNELKENDRQEYLEGILDRIVVRLDTETNDHHLKITFKMGLVGDGIEYADPKIKSKGYTVVEGDTDAELILPYAQTQQMHKDARTSGRWDEEVKKKLPSRRKK